METFLNTSNFGLSPPLSPSSPSAESISIKLFPFAQVTSLAFPQFLPFKPMKASRVKDPQTGSREITLVAAG